MGSLTQTILDNNITHTTVDLPDSIYVGVEGELVHAPSKYCTVTE